MECVMADDGAGKIDVDVAKGLIESARFAHDRWWKGTGKNPGAKLAYDYYDSEQMPDGFPADLKVWVQINRVKDDQDSLMGIHMNKAPDVVVQGRGADSQDKNRTKVVKSAVQWCLDEAEIMKVGMLSIFDYLLVGMAFPWTKWDPTKITKMGTLGMLDFEHLSPGKVKRDPDARGFFSNLDRYVMIDRELNRFQIERELMALDMDHSVDVDAIMNATKREGHWDFPLNSGIKDKNRMRASLINMEYVRIVRKQLNYPGTDRLVVGEDKKPVIVPVPEYRQALIAGDEIFYDRVSPVDRANVWTIAILMGIPLLNSAYSNGSFKSSKSTQDMLNVILTMILNAQSRSMKQPWQILKGTVMDLDTMIKGLSGSDPFMEWEYTQDMRDSKISMDAAKPSRAQYGAINPQVMAMFESIWEKHETTGTRNVLKGDVPAGVKSGKGIHALQRAGLQPSHFMTAMLDLGFKMWGNCIWEHIRTNLTYEVELPVQGETGEPEGVKINHEVSNKELSEFVQMADDDARVKARLKMISVRDGDEHLTFEAWLNKTPGMNLKEGIEGFDGDFRENDLGFGNYDVSLNIDTGAEQDRLERVEKVRFFFPHIAAVAPRTALKWGLEVMNEPDRVEILKDIDEEDIVRRKGLQVIEQEQQAQQQQQQQQQQRAPGAATAAGGGGAGGGGAVPVGGRGGVGGDVGPL